ncbi:MAG: hypothetical protein CR981_01120 [Proteobacteria bacterium]|nr:MAG: hypothetical protein CR981_01120 [Pseudomonadota bacterium]
MAKSLAEIFLRINPGRFYFLKCILEGYDNLGVLSAIDGRVGLIRIKIVSHHLPVLMQVLADLAPVIKKQ